VISDNGHQFNSDKFQRFSLEWEFEHVTSGPGHAKSNGLAESAVKTVKPKLAESVQEGRNKMKMKQAFYYNQNATNLLPLEKGDTVRLSK